VTENSESFPQHRATPVHNSQSPRSSSSPPARPLSSFEAAFQHTQPSDRAAPPRPASKWKVTRSLSKFWQENIQESLRTFDIPLDNVFSPICMTPTNEQVGRMYARSKCMELLLPNHSSLLLSPTKGQPLCFVARAGEGLPIHIQQALFFFASVSHSLLDMAHFAAPTTATNVVVRARPARQARADLTPACSTTGATPESYGHWSAQAQGWSRTHQLIWMTSAERLVLSRPMTSSSKGLWMLQMPLQNRSSL
jgi:hypothetical protein